MCSLSGKEFLLVFTVQKLRNSLKALSETTEGPAHMLSPVYGLAAAGPMVIPSPTDAQWQPVEVGLPWGLEHGTSWLMTPLQAPASMQGLPLVLQLYWDTPGDDSLLLRLEATVFLDGHAIGAFDWKHPVLLLPECDTDKRGSRGECPTLDRGRSGWGADSEVGGRFIAAPNRPQITASGHGHLDVGWMWPYWRTRQKIAHSISNVLGLMERYPEYHYSQSQPQMLQWLKEDVPELYAGVKQRVAEGRFEPVGAMWIEADCNLTSGEALIRQIIHWMHFWQQEFGVKPRQILLPDVFGYSAALPQIMRGCNIPTFMTTKISWNQFNRMPCDTFRWRGIDGSEVLTHFITAPSQDAKTTFYSYNGPLQPSDMTGTWMNYRQQDINDHLLYLHGWGDGGGGPTEEQMERMQIMADLPDFPQVRAGRAGDYFAELYQRVWENPACPTWVVACYLEYHLGTYTSQARVKQANRRAELFYPQ